MGQQCGDQDCAAVIPFCRIGIRECIDGVCKCCVSPTCADDDQENVGFGHKVFSFEEYSSNN